MTTMTVRVAFVGSLKRPQQVADAVTHVIQMAVERGDVRDNTQPVSIASVSAYCQDVERA